MTDNTHTFHKPNSLIRETSPYLLQHAYNPVAWYPWGESAFSAARERNVPIFLSIGYSTCYWCHVMERESFESDAAAAVLNRHFVAIKVDREQRPDIDDLYMAAVQILTRSGGWPMSVWLTPPGARSSTDPGLKPFYAGTYFPPAPAFNRPSFTQVLEGISRAWTEERPQVLDQADQLALAVREHFNETTEPDTGTRLDEREVGISVETLLRTYDATNGGFGGAPKFPQPHYTRFLLATVDEIEQDDAKDKAELAIRHTLDKMACGGIHDHIGGGFHRYAVDELWIVPHFEKMLYDNGLLLSSYADAFLRWRDPLDARVLMRTRAWIEREMTATIDGKSGPFFAALDAEVDHREGLNYLWTQEEIDALIVDDKVSQDDAVLLSRVLGIQTGPNFQDPHHPNDPERTVLNMADRPDRLAGMLGIDQEIFLKRLDSASDALLKVRDTRKQPHRDEKVLTSWNGLAIAGLADSAAAIRDTRALDLALNAADWCLTHMRDDSGLFVRSAVIDESGGARIAPSPLMLEDQANMLQGLLSLDRAARLLNADRPDLRQTALSIAHAVQSTFAEQDMPAVLYDVAPSQDERFARTRSTYDGATPSAIGSYLHVMIELFEITQDRAWLDHAVDVLRSVSEALKASPVSMLESVRALFRLLQHDGSLPEKLGPVGQEQAESSPVQIMSAPARITPNDDGTIRVPIRIEIDEGFHINAATQPDDSDSDLPVSVIPLRARMHAGSTDTGITLELPDPELYTGSAFNEDDQQRTIHVYSGIIEGALVLDRDAILGTNDDESFVTMTYQACTDSACYEPMTVSLDIAFTTSES